MDSSPGMRGVRGARGVRGWSPRGVGSAQLCHLRGVRGWGAISNPALSSLSVSPSFLYIPLSPLSPLSIPYLSKEIFGEGFSKREGLAPLNREVPCE